MFSSAEENYEAVPRPRRTGETRVEGDKRYSAVLVVIFRVTTNKISVTATTSVQLKIITKLFFGAAVAIFELNYVVSIKIS